MRIKDGFVINKVGGAYVAVAVGERADEFHALVRTNVTGAFLWECLAGNDYTPDSLADELVKEYGIDKELALSDTLKFIGQLRDGGLLDE